MSDKRLAHVYYIKNKYNGRAYVGSTVNLSSRKSKHFSTLRRGIHRNRRLQKDYDRYGGERAFELVVAGTAIGNKSTFRFEQALIDGFENVYNILPRAGKARGRKYTGLTLQKMSKSMQGRKPSKKTIERSIESKKGKRLSKETRERMSRSHIRRYESGEGNFYSKLREEDVVRLHEALKGGLSRREISKKYDLPYSTVCAILRGETWRMVYQKFKNESEAV